MQPEGQGDHPGLFRPGAPGLARGSRPGSRRARRPLRTRFRWRSPRI